MPPAFLTTRTSAALPASWRQATQVRTGLWGGFAVALSLAGLDVDAVAGELGRQPRVLAVSPDGERQLRAGHHHGGCARGAVDRYRLRLGWTYGRRDERLWVVGPWNDVDVLAGELTEDGAVAHALGADASADRVEARLGGRDRDLRAQAGLARDCA